MTGDSLDPIIHSQARLRIMTTLTALGPGDRLTFPRLQSLLDTTAGNLSTHLRRLEDAEYVQVTKGHQGRVPTTQVEATRRGRLAFEDYVTQLQELLRPPVLDGHPEQTDGPQTDGPQTDEPQTTAVPAQTQGET